MAVSQKQQNRVMKVISSVCEQERYPDLRSDDSRLLALKEADLPLILRKLESLELVTLYECDHDLYEIGLTDEGFVYFEKSAVERWHFWSRSVIIPFGVSLLVSLFASAINKGWFPQLWAWLKKVFIK